MKSILFLSLLLLTGVYGYGQKKTDKPRYFFISYNLKDSATGGCVIGQSSLYTNFGFFSEDGAYRWLRKSDKIPAGNLVITFIYEFKSKQDYDDFNSDIK